MNRSVLFVFIATVGLSVLVLAACGRDGFDDEILAGPCVEEYGEPIVLITNVVEAGSGDGIAVVAISDIEFGVGTAEHREITNPLWGESMNLTEGEDGALLCEIPCGFGSTPGMYTFTVAAEGYEANEVSVDANYAEWYGGCPSFSDGGTEVEVELMPLNHAGE